MIPDPLPIHDLYVRALDVRKTDAGSALTVLRYSDHLLRRFGLAEFYELTEGQRWTPPIQPIADEAWALVRGKVDFDWEDRREHSPSFGRTYQFRAEQPTVVLVPFGVEFRVRSKSGPAFVIRLSTHEDGIDR